MNNITFKGPFKNYLQDFIELKKSVGYKYNTERGHLRRFDKFTIQLYPHNHQNLSKEIVMSWCSKRSYESQNNLRSRTSVIRQFAIYLDNIGLNAYIVPKNHFNKGPQYIPHIYSKEELLKFFKETDKCNYSIECPYRHLIMPIFFRMIYICGLRVSEARLLKVEDVDLNNGILSIHHSKKDNSRLVPMTKKLTEKCRKYFEQVHKSSSDTEYFFPGINEKPMTITNVYHNFRRFLWKAGISHGGRGKGPRIHDFRHTYAIHCLKKWSEQGKDLMVYLPILRVYLGHDSFEETAYYLRLTADVFPMITLKLETAYKDLIPVLDGDYYETN